MALNTTALDYAEDILTLEAQAQRQFERGDRKSLQAGVKSLRAIQDTCTMALRILPHITPQERAWFQRHFDKAASACT